MKKSFKFTYKNAAGQITSQGTVESSTLRGACSLAGAFAMRKTGEGKYITVNRHNPAKYRFGSKEREEAAVRYQNFSPSTLEVTPV